MTRLTRQFRRVMSGVAEMHELGQLIDGTFGDYLIAFPSQDRVAASADRRCRKIGALARQRRGMASGAIEFQWGMNLMAEWTRRQRQQRQAAT
jgi:hypothetical protein